MVSPIGIRFRSALPPVLLPLLLLAAGCGRAPAGAWYRGNTHTHSLWSDGDLAPEGVVARYREAGYHFLVLSDHDVFQSGEKWYRISEEGQGRLTPGRVAELERTFGPGWIQERTVNGRREMRLKTMAELRERFEETGVFLLVPGHEISDGAQGLPLHFNALNTTEVIPQARRASLAASLEADVAAFERERARSTHPLLLHLNHPNWYWAQTAGDLAQEADLRFFEVYNASTGCNHEGDATHPSTDAMWDAALAQRLEAGRPLLYGVASDDAHNYFRRGPDVSAPLRGWIVVRAGALQADSLVLAMERGDFYASTGVELADVRHDRRSYRVRIKAEPGIHYTTLFIGTRRGAGAPVGEVLLETIRNPAVYRFRGDERYVRAKVISSKPEPDPAVPGNPQRAWTQPAVPPGRR
jgi:hypothetical protein